MNGAEKISNDQLKEAAGQSKPKDFVLTAGDGILVTGGSNNWAISSDPAQFFKNLKTATILICVNGNPMNLDVYVARGPY